MSDATPPQPPPLKRRGSEKAPSSSEEGVGGGGTIAAALRAATERLAATSDTARLDAELLMAHALGTTRSHLLLSLVDGAVPDGFAALVQRRALSEPIAYILGTQDFMGLTFKVSPAVLIPRGDSEVLVERALAARGDARRVLDCGTGSGALLLAALHHLPWASGLGIDRSEEALDVAHSNAFALALAQRADFALADWTAPGWAQDLGQFDLILANPPYVETDADLAPDVRSHEPAGALFAGADGLNDYRVLIPQLPALLADEGAAMIEIGASQAPAVTAIAEAAGFAAALHHDLAGRPRVLELKIPLGNRAAGA